MKISIITVTKNSANSLKSCINSVINQSYENVEYIIIDNCSTDDTLQIAKSYLDQITRIVSEPDDGIFDAMNKGIKLASGDIIGFLHSDDFYADNEVLKEVANKFATDNYQALYSDLQYITKEKRSRIIRHWQAGKYNKSSFAKGWMPPHPTFFVKKECYSKYGFYNTHYKISADYELMLRLLYKHQIRCSYIKKVLVKMTIGGTSNRNFRNIIQKSKEDLMIIRKAKIGGVKTLLYKNLFKIKQLRLFTILTARLFPLNE